MAIKKQTEKKELEKNKFLHMCLFDLAWINEHAVKIDESFVG